MEKERYRIERSNIVMCEPMPFNQHWEARVAVPIDELDVGEALIPNFTSFRPGDLVNICAFEKNDWRRLKEIAAFRIVSCDDKRIEAIMVSDIIKVSERKPAQQVVSEVKLEIVQTGRAFEVRDQFGNTLDSFVERSQAEAFMGQQPGQLKPQVKDDRSAWKINRTPQGRFLVQNDKGEPMKEFKKREEAEEFLKAA